MSKIHKKIAMITAKIIEESIAKCMETFYKIESKTKIQG